MMARYTVRIELREADTTDYEKLSKKLKLRGFTRHIAAKNGDKHVLPSAEYSFSSKYKSTRDVRDLAYQIAKTVNPDPAVLATKTSARAWRGLHKI